MIDRNHPAVNEAARVMYEMQNEIDGLNIRWEGEDSVTKGNWCDDACDILGAALPHLTADDLRHTPAGWALMAEAWEDGAQAAWGESGEGWNGEYTGRSGPPCAFRAHNPTLPNPYKGTPND